MTAIDPLLMEKFTTNLELLSQQKRAKLAEYCRVESGAGSEAFRMLSQVSQTSTFEITTRARQVGDQTLTFDGRWVFPKKIGFETIIDKIETLRTNIEPQGPIIMNAIAAHMQTRDKRFVEAFFGDATTGKSSSGTTTSFDSNNVVAVNEGGSVSGLTVEKITKAIEILEENEVDRDMEPVYMAISPKQHNNLLNQTRVTSGDFNSNLVLRDGRVTSYAGFNIIVSNFLTTDSNGYRRNPVWVPSGMGCGLWEGLKVDVRELPNYTDKPLLVEAILQEGFTRLEEAKCVEIKSSEA